MLAQSFSMTYFWLRWLQINSIDFHLFCFVQRKAMRYEQSRNNPQMLIKLLYSFLFQFESECD